MKKSLLKLALGIVAIAFGISSFAQTTYTYTGAMQTFTAPATGTYQLEVWGAQGGEGGYWSNIQYSGTGGNGGYSYGEFTLNAGQTLNIYVGGQGEGYPTTTTQMVGPNKNGGWNGGGNVVNANPGCGGGGASDIRFGGTTLNSRVIVAGGGGGSGNAGSAIQLSNGGEGGGLSGVTKLNTTQFSNRVPGAGGTQTAGNALGIGQTGTENLSGGGGGGYWGGTKGANSTGGGGGSGYIGGVTNGSTIAGDLSMPDPNGGNMTGRPGDGIARVTSLCNGGPSAAITAFTQDTVCLNDPTVTIPAGTPAGGAYSGNGVSGNTFIPSIAGVGSHYVVYSNTDSCSVITMDSTMIVVKGLLSITMNPFNSDTVCLQDQPITVPAGVPSGGTYSGTGVSGGTFTPSVAGVGTHYVIYTAMGANNCSNSDSVMIVVASCVGINENASLNKVSIYPNPTSGLFTINLGIHIGAVNYSISTVEGRIVSSQQGVNANNITIDISNESKGIYILKVEDATSAETYKIIKE